MDQVTIEKPKLSAATWLGLTLISDTDVLRSKSVRGGSVVKGPPGVVEMENLLFVPGWRCLFTKDGRRVEETVSLGSYPGIRPITAAKLAKHDPPETPVRAEQVIDEVVTFGGPTIPHYGHHLTDGMARKWWSDDNPSLITAPPSEYQNRLYEMGTQRRLICPDRPTLFRRVVVPLPSILSDGVIHDVHDLEHRRIAENAMLMSDFDPGARVYISRSRLNGVRSVEGEEQIEALLERAGYRIVHPQELSIPDQIAVFNRAQVIVGCSGSAMHTSLFHLGGPLKIVTLCGPRFNRRFSLVDRIKSYQATYVHCLTLVERDARGAIANVRVDMERAVEGLKMAGVI